MGKPIELKYNQLQLRDVVGLFPQDDPTGQSMSFRTAVVIQITDKDVTFYRPYAVTEDFTYTGGVIPYVGIEVFTVPVNHTTGTVYLLERQDTKRMQSGKA